jgi:hypothetical protein
MAVLYLDGRGLDATDPPGLARLATEGVAGEVARLSGCAVLSQSDIETMANVEASRQACGDDSADSCLTELGAALGVDRLVTGSLSHSDGRFAIALRVLNMGSAVVEARAETSVRDTGDVRGAAGRAARLLYGIDDAPTPLALAGYSTAAVGAVTAVVGGVLVGHAESQLTTARQQNKEAAVVEGYGGLVTLGVGVVVVGVGAALALAGAP